MGANRRASSELVVKGFDNSVIWPLAFWRRKGSTCTPLGPTPLQVHCPWAGSGVNKKAYPYLAYWKHCGFDDFPSPPPDQLAEELVRPRKDKFWESYRDRQKDLLDNNEGLRALHEILPAGFLRDTEAMFMGGIEEAIEGNVATVLQEKLNHEHRRIFRGLSRAHKKIQKSRDPRTREQAIRTFINQYIPDTQGGGPALTNTQKRILQRIYKEMQSCIKYVRYMTKWRIGEDLETEEIKEFVLEDIPEIDIIFTKDELPMLFEETSVATTAAKIILKRLQKFSPRFNITSRRFQDILTGISPL